MALGYFDGVHVGNQHVIQQAKKQAEKLANVEKLHKKLVNAGCMGLDG